MFGSSVSVGQLECSEEVVDGIENTCRRGAAARKVDLANILYDSSPSIQTNDQRRSL